MFLNYYETEKMIQIRAEDALHEAKRERLERMVKSRKNERGWWESLISLVDHIIRPKSLNYVQTAGSLANRCIRIKS